MRLFRPLIFIALVLPAACSTVNRKPASFFAEGQPQPRHVIFLVHGIGGNKKNFGHMEEALTLHLNRLGGGRYHYEVASIEYDTESDTKDAFDFSKQLDKEIDKYFHGEISPQDKISFVSHSQGGVVTTIWVYQASGHAPEYHDLYASHVDSVVTLATPFWGAKSALFALPFKRWGLTVGIKAGFGEKQLQELSFGSDTVYWLRRRAIESEQNHAQDPFANQIRLLNVAGYVGWIVFQPASIGTKIPEDDTAVILPSANYDFLYAQSLKQDYQDGDRLLASEFNETAEVPFSVVDAIHLSPLVDAPQLSRGIAQVQNDCIANVDCDHPTFKMILQHILHEPLAAHEQSAAKMTSFLIDLDIRFPSGEKVAVDDVKIDFLGVPKDVEVARKTEFLSHGARSALVDGSEMVREYFTGTVKSDYMKDIKSFKTVVMSVYAKGYKSRIIEAKVRATHSTFIEVNLEKL